MALDYQVKKLASCFNGIVANDCIYASLQAKL